MLLKGRLGYLYTSSHSLPHFPPISKAKSLNVPLICLIICTTLIPLYGRLGVTSHVIALMRSFLIIFWLSGSHSVPPTLNPLVYCAGGLFTLWLWANLPSNLCEVSQHFYPACSSIKILNIKHPRYTTSFFLWNKKNRLLHCCFLFFLCVAFLSSILFLNNTTLVSLTCMLPVNRSSCTLTCSHSLFHFISSPHISLSCMLVLSLFHSLKSCLLFTPSSLWDSNGGLVMIYTLQLINFQSLLLNSQ